MLVNVDNWWQFLPCLSLRFRMKHVSLPLSTFRTLKYQDLSEKSKPAPWIAFHSSWRFIGKYPKSTCFFETRNFIPKTSTWQVLTQHPAGNHVYNSHEMEIDLKSLGDLLSVQCQCLKQTCGYTFLSHQLVGPPCCHGENTNILPLECAAESW